MPDMSFMHDYLPEMPSVPDIPLPEPLEKAKNQINTFND